MAKRVYVDLSEFISAPYSTGIQRVAAQLCVHWPHSCELVPVRVSEGRLYEVGATLLPMMHQYFQVAPQQRQEFMAAVRGQVSAAVARQVPVPLDAPVFVPEVFYDSGRVAFYREMLARQPELCFFVAFDFLPLTDSQYFPPNLPYEHICGYFRLLRSAPNVGFISHATKEVYFRRLRREPAGNGPVLWLGADGLAPDGRSALWSKCGGRLRFCAVGTIEPRKNHLVILQAFERAVKSGMDLELIFLGRIGWLDEKSLGRLKEAASRSAGRFRIVESPTDENIRDTLSGSCASIYLSSCEGYGLPPVESLWLGIPVIASNTIPSLQQADSHGIHFVPEINPALVQAAFEKFADDTFRAAKAAEARSAPLRSWRDFAHESASWVLERT